MIARDPPHYIQPLTTTTTPKRLVWLEVWGVDSTDRGSITTGWLGGRTATTHFTAKGRRVDSMVSTYDDPKWLWVDIDAFCKVGSRTVMFTYDLPTTLRISRALLHLPRLGWKLQNIVLERTAAWAAFTNGRRKLVMCDLMAWSQADPQTLFADCVTWEHLTTRRGGVRAVSAYEGSVDVETIRSAGSQIFAWIEQENLGPFRPTGSGQSYAAWRRRFLTHKPFVHDDTDLLIAEREAMHTGRCEAWRWGKQDGGPFTELDMQAAYCHIAAECDLPLQLASTRRRVPPDALLRLADTHCVLAHVHVNTDVPAVPVQYAGRTVWPVGKFSTVLWDPELRLLQETGASWVVERAWVYRRAPILRAVAEWTLEQMQPQLSLAGPMAQRVAKHWSRCLVGRLGLRYRAWEPFGSGDPYDLQLVTYIDVDEGISTDLLCVGEDRMLLGSLEESPNSLPSIPGWIMSECRRRLWSLMSKIEPGGLLYVDTDCIIATQHAARNVAHDGGFDALGPLHVKDTHVMLSIHGPRNITTGQEDRISGIPKSARRTGPLEFNGQIMRSLKESMRAGELDRVTAIPRTWKIGAPDLRRKHLPNGTTEPYRLEQRETDSVLC